MSDFNREDRYIVIKRKDLNVVPFAALQSFLEHLGALASFLPQREFVVVESDWPECEQVWRMIEARVTGQPSDLERLEAEAQALREEVAALRARVVVPDGYALVPVEPTREMFIAVNKEDDKAYAGGCDHGAQFDWLWEAAIDAAPRLKGKAVSEELLRRLSIHKPGYDADHYEAVEELRDLLDGWKEAGDVLVHE